MKPLLSCVLLALGITACASNPDRTHRGDLLDDKVTAQRVQAKLNGAGPAFEHIRVNAINGTIVLSGAVGSPQERDRAEEFAKSVHRSIKLDDQLQIQPIR